MKKKLKIDVDCANCAAKMESAVKKLDGVTDAAISFMSQRLILEADEDRFDSVLKEVIRTCKRVEPDCEIYL
ncbi:cation transporter [Anaeromassilibacillus sp. An200]|uniref:Cation transporter n=1 Tax=Candidatus Caccousia stercoris TaxID=2840723 RepID=A0A9D1FSV5_9FIRM|nr:cation transporter [Anaeromassilibacillus sp. An200]OUP14367.1 heavy metal transporter [Anaeromassilibacillus sp. An200]HIS79169.1 cation transporter [Candidatus Caccousia stercoris]